MPPFLDLAQKILHDVWDSAHHWIQTQGFDAGPGHTLMRKFYHSDNGSIAFDISDAPAAGQKIVGVDVVVSVDTTCHVAVKMETSGNQRAGAYMCAYSTLPLTLRGHLVGDAMGKKLQAQTDVPSKVDVTVNFYGSVEV